MTAISTRPTGHAAAGPAGRAADSPPLTRRPHTVARALAVAALASAPAVQAQQSIDLITGPVDFTTWTLAGTATAANLTPGNGFTYSTLRLTLPTVGDQVGSAFAPGALNWDFNLPFQIDWVWSIPALDSSWLRGDGFTITLAAAPYLGGGGSGLGYEDFSGNPSVAFAIDTFHFDGEPVSPSLQILANGNVTPLASTETGLGDAIRDPDFAWFGQLLYTPSGLDDQQGVLTGSIEHINLGSFSVSAAVDFSALAGAPVYYGFTAATGLATDGHTIQWGAALPVPEPGSAWLWLAGLLGLAFRGSRAVVRR